VSLRLVLALGFALSAAACQFVPSIGIDQARAVELAERHARPVDRLVEARLARAIDLPELATARLPADAVVWRITFSSSEVRPCGPAPGGQRCRIDSKTVIIDATTGAVVTSEQSGSTVP
jgi:hypothetical protein